VLLSTQAFCFRCLASYLAILSAYLPPLPALHLPACPCLPLPAVPEGGGVMAIEEDDAAALWLAHTLSQGPWHHMPAAALLRLLNIMCYDIAQVGRPWSRRVVTSYRALLSVCT